MLVIEERVHTTMVNYFVTNCVFADLALKRLITVVETVRSLEFDCLASEPTLQALIMHQFDTSCTKTHIEKRVTYSISSFKTNTTISLVTGMSTCLAGCFFKGSYTLSYAFFDSGALIKVEIATVFERISRRVDELGPSLIDWQKLLSLMLNIDLISMLDRLELFEIQLNIT